nr:hypothetical protein [Saprospiraceae bacterium]
MKIKTIKKRCCTAISGGLLAIVPMFLLFSVVSTQLDAQQGDPHYSEITMHTAFETLKTEVNNLEMEVKNLGASNENFLLMEYYTAVINELNYGATFEDAFSAGLNVFFNSQYSHQRSNLHLSIFGMPQIADPSGGDPGNPQVSAVATASYFLGEVEPEFKQLIDAIESAEGHPSSMQSLFDFMNTNK